MSISLNKKFIVLTGAILLLLALFLGETALLRVTTMQRGEIDKEIRIQEIALRNQVMAKTRLVERYKQALVELERFPMGEAGDLVTLFANIEGEMAKNGLTVDSIRPVGLDPATMTATTEVAFRGNFFSVMRTMADWRNGMQPIRLSSLSIMNEPGKNEPKTVIGASVSAKAVLVSKVKPAQEGGK